jgi:hypothetical protein
VAGLDLVGNANLSGHTAQLRENHSEYVGVGIAQGKSREPLRVARVRELDSGQLNVAAPFTQHRRHGINHLQRLLAVRVLDEQDRWFRCTGHVYRSLARAVVKRAAAESYFGGRD